MRSLLVRGSRRWVMVSLVVCGLAAPAAAQDAGGGLLREIVAQAEGGDAAGAIARLEAERRAGTATAPQSALLGALLLESGKAREAAEILEPLAAATDADPAVLFNAGRAALALGRSEAGERYLERSVEKLPASPAARELGLLRQRQGRALDAYRLLRPWALSAPDDTEARLAAASCAVELGRPAAAEALLAGLLRDRPGDLRPRFIEVQALLYQQRLDEALEAADQTLAMAPDHPDAVYQKGAVLMAAGSPEAAEKELRRALELSPGHTAAMSDLAVLLIAQNRRQEARRLLERLLVLRPDDAVAADNLERLEPRGGEG